MQIRSWIICYRQAGAREEYEKIGSSQDLREGVTEGQYEADECTSRNNYLEHGSTPECHQDVQMPGDTKGIIACA
jgi:hypothetical protein